MVDIKLGKMYKFGIRVKMCCCCYSCGVKHNGSKLHIVAVRFFALMWKTMALFSIIFVESLSESAFCFLHLCPFLLQAQV